MVQDRCLGRVLIDVEVCGGTQFAVGQDQKGSVQHRLRAIDTVFISTRAMVEKRNTEDALYQKVGKIKKADACSKSDHVRLK